MEVTAFDGRAFSNFVVAGSYFLRKYSGVINDLNVFPVPDGDTGSNMYFTVRAAALEAGRSSRQPLGVVAAATAAGGLMGARGNSGVIMAAMFRGFADHVRDRREIDTLGLATGMRAAVSAARAALLRPVEGTIISVAHAAAEMAFSLARGERDFYRVALGIVRAAAEALAKTTEQLPILKEAGVVDAGGAGLLYFLEGILRFSAQTARTTAFPQRPLRKRAFSAGQIIGENKYCTEFILEDARCEALALREALSKKGESLIVGGSLPTLKIHIHTDDPNGVTSFASEHGRLTRVKVDNMEQQHRLLLLDGVPPTISVVAVANGDGFDRILRELGAENTIDGTANPSVRDLLLGVNKCLSDRVYLLTNDANVTLAAQAVVGLSKKDVTILPTRDSMQGIAALLELRSAEDTPPEGLLETAARVKTAVVYFAGKDAALGGTAVKSGKPAATYAGKVFTANSVAQVTHEVVAAMKPVNGALVTLYYAGTQKEKDARDLREELSSWFPQIAVECYYGGQSGSEYLVSLDE